MSSLSSAPPAMTTPIPDPNEPPSRQPSVALSTASSSKRPHPASSTSQGASRTKRKRLAKACDSCHKSKRRCDGTAPCANCDFAGKACVYTDSSGRVVEPPISRATAQAEAEARQERRKSTLSATDPSTGENETQGGTDVSPNAGLLQSQWSTSQVHGRRTDPPRSVSTGNGQVQRSKPVDFLVDREEVRQVPNPSLVLEPGLTKELVNLFLAHVHPCNLILHRPTFLNDLSEGLVPAYLLYSIFAVAAPLSVQPKIRTTPTWHAGEKFARVAVSLMFNHEGALIQEPSLEVAQALVLLTWHECVYRRPNQTDSYMQLAVRLLRTLGVHNLDKDTPSTSPRSMDRKQWIRDECLRRVFYIIYLTELLSAVFTQRPVSHPDEVVHTFLPIQDATFELVLMKEIGRRDYLFASPHPIEGPLAISEYGFLMRVGLCFADINRHLHLKLQEIARGGNAGPSPARLTSSHVALQQCEYALTAWERSLPEDLRFDEENLHIQISTLEASGAVGGWSYCYMHALAECCVLSIHELLEVDGDMQALRNHKSRQQRALDNLTVILGSLGTRGRLNLMMATILIAVIKHRTAISGKPDPHVTTWCAEYESLWGVSLDQIMSVEYRKDWVSVHPDNRPPYVQERHGSPGRDRPTGQTDRPDGISSVILGEGSEGSDGRPGTTEGSSSSKGTVHSSWLAASATHPPYQTPPQPPSIRSAFPLRASDNHPSLLPGQHHAHHTPHPYHPSNGNSYRALEPHTLHSSSVTGGISSGLHVQNRPSSPSVASHQPGRPHHTTLPPLHSVGLLNNGRHEPSRLPSRVPTPSGMSPRSRSLHLPKSYVSTGISPSMRPRSSLSNAAASGDSEGTPGSIGLPGSLPPLHLPVSPGPRTSTPTHGNGNATMPMGMSWLKDDVRNGSV